MIGKQKIAAVLLLIATAPPAASDGGASKRKIACKTAANASSCYWVRGRLAAYNGTPSFRLWKIGTDRQLGILSGPGAEKRDALDNEHPELPPSVSTKLKSFQNRVVADFEVCPLEPEREGAMQAACIEDAKNIRAERDRL